MKKILCTLPNASTSINGIAFEAHAKGMLSVEAVEDDVADRFASIPGYEAVAVGSGGSKASGKGGKAQSGGDKLSEPKKAEAKPADEPKEPAGKDEDKADK